MFRKEMAARLSRIFGLTKVSYDEPGESFEQDTLFVEIEECLSRATEGKAYAKVTGSVVIFSQRDKLPYGFFAKRLAQAALADTKPFFFFDVDVDALNSPARMQNISERRARFVYLYSAQYDPNQGALTSLDVANVKYPKTYIMTEEGENLSTESDDKLTGG